VGVLARARGAETVSSARAAIRPSWATLRPTASGASPRVGAASRDDPSLIEAALAYSSGAPLLRLSTRRRRSAGRPQASSWAPLVSGPRSPRRCSEQSSARAPESNGCRTGSQTNGRPALPGMTAAVLDPPPSLRAWPRAVDDGEFEMALGIELGPKGDVDVKAPALIGGVVECRTDTPAPRRSRPPKRPPRNSSLHLPRRRTAAVFSNGRDGGRPGR